MDWTTLGAIGALAIAVQKAVEFTRDTLDPHAKLPRMVWSLLAIGLAILGVFATKVRIDGFGQTDAAKVVTGFVVGGTSNIAHKVAKRLGGLVPRQPR